MFRSALASLFFVLPPLISIANPTDPLVALAEQASQSVVFIATESNPYELAYGQRMGYHEYFRPVYDYFWPSEYAHGSGFIISPDGFVVTNAHVVQEATKVLVVIRTDEIRLCKASVLGKDFRTDIAVLKIEDQGDIPLPSLRFGDSDKIQVGQRVLCIGNPMSSELESSVSTGIISGLDRNNLMPDSIEGYIQTDTAINPGNSGGPLLNTHGEVIGVVFGSGAGYEGLSFAIPSHSARHIARQIIANGKVSQGFLGVELDFDNDVESAFDFYHFARNEGACIETVIKNSPAEKAGLKTGDIILAVDRHFVRAAESLRNRIAILEPGTSVELIIGRDGELLEITLELGSEESSKAYSRLELPYIVI